MKKVLSFILTLAIFLSNLVFANGATYNGIEYREDYSTATVIGYSGREKKVTVPESVNSKIVVAVAANAFQNKNITSVTLPESVTSIGEGAFRGCSSLSSVTVPKDVTYIGENAFNTGSADNFTIRCFPNSYTDDYALSHNISVSYILDAPIVKAEATANNSVHLSWQRVRGADEYYVYRVDDKNERIMLGKTSSTVYDVPSLNGNTQYRFFVGATDDDLTSISEFDEKYIISIKTLFDSPQIKASSGSDYIYLNWQNIDGAEKYSVYTVDEKQKLKKIATVTDSEYTYKNLPIGVQYTFFVSVIDGDNAESKFDANNLVTISTVCDLPEVEVKASWVSFDLYWKAEEGAEYYAVFYSTGTGYQLADYVYPKSEGQKDFTYTIGGKLSFLSSYRVLVRAYNKADEGSRFDDNSGQTCRLKGFWVFTGLIAAAVVAGAVIATVIIVRRRKEYYEIKT